MMVSGATALTAVYMAFQLVMKAVGCWPYSFQVPCISGA